MSGVSEKEVDEMDSEEETGVEAKKKKEEITRREKMKRVKKVKRVDSSPIMESESEDEDMRASEKKKEVETGGGSEKDDDDMDSEEEISAEAKKDKGKEKEKGKKIKRVQSGPRAESEGEESDEGMGPPPNQQMQDKLQQLPDLFEELDEDVSHALNGEATLSGRISHLDAKKILGTLLGLKKERLEYVLGLGREELLSKFDDMVPSIRKRKEGEKIKSPQSK